ncbi:MAG: hypothetical protein LBE31_09600, partial [Deltaproteobacteria bacterium]|nr:hypothetical protein [Deltaproteobacteria bacterium]
MNNISSNVRSGLEKFIEAKKPEIDKLKSQGPPRALEIQRPSFSEALIDGYKARGLSIIAEYKRASPSLGDIDLDFTPQNAALSYAASD